MVDDFNLFLYNGHPPSKSVVFPDFSRKLVNFGGGYGLVDLNVFLGLFLGKQACNDGAYQGKASCYDCHYN